MKTINQNLNYIEDNPVKITIESRHLPGGSDHNLICWVCEKRHAIYSMHPEWIFKPCNKCERKIHGKPKKWWEFW